MMSIATDVDVKEALRFELARYLRSPDTHSQVLVDFDRLVQNPAYWGLVRFVVIHHSAHEASWLLPMICDLQQTLEVDDQTLVLDLREPPCSWIEASVRGGESRRLKFRTDERVGKFSVRVYPNLAEATADQPAKFSTLGSF